MCIQFSQDSLWTDKQWWMQDFEDEGRQPRGEGPPILAPPPLRSANDNIPSIHNRFPSVLEGLDCQCQCQVPNPIARLQH